MASKSDKQTPATTEVSWVWFGALGTFVLACACMATSLPGEFIFDDIPLIQGNTRVHSFDHVAALLRGNLWDTGFVTEGDERTRGFWRPLVQLSYASNWVLGEGDPFWFHLTNLLVHGLNAALLLFALRRWTEHDVGATVGALLFALHPVQTETVAWIAGRTDSLCCLGLLLAGLGLSRRLRGRSGGLALEVLGVLVSLGSKESFILLPIFLALEVWALEGRPPPSGALAARYLKTAAPHLLLVVVYLVYHQAFVRVEPLKIGVTWGNRLPLFLEAWGRYTALVVWPDDLTLGRALFAFSGNAIAANWGYVAVGVTTLAGIGWTLWTWRKAGTLHVAAWCYAGMILPVSSIVWLDYDVLVSPRFLYIPMVCVALAAAAACQKLKLSERAWFKPALALLLVGLFSRSLVRAYDFSSPQRFWRAEATHNPRYTSAWSFFIVRELNQGRPRLALRLVHDAFATLSSTRDTELARTGLIVPALSAIIATTPALDTDTFEQVSQFSHAIRNMKAAELHLPRIGLSLRIGEASLLSRALQGNRRRLAVLEADARARLGQPERAAELLKQVLEECPKCWPLFNAALPILARTEELTLARHMLAEARQRAPDDVLQQMHGFLQTATALRSRMRKNPESVPAKVAYFSFAGAYAEAYRLARAEYERRPSPKLAQRVAELAAVAGDEQYALALFAKSMTRTQAKGQIDQIKRLAGQADQPVPPDHWTPPPKAEPS